MSYSYYFLLGQVITFLGITWQFTLCVNLGLIVIIELIHFDSLTLQPISLLIGWISVVFLSNQILQSRRALSFTSIPMQIFLLIYIIEIIVFVLLTGFIFYDDSNPFFWGLLIIFHIIFILCVTLADSRLEKKVEMYDDDHYDKVFIACILASDFSFLFMCLFDWINSSTFFSTLCVAPISFLAGFGVYHFLKKNNPIEV
jgi:hypothetical protein